MSNGTLHVKVTQNIMIYATTTNVQYATNHRVIPEPHVSTPLMCPQQSYPDTTHVSITSHFSTQLMGLINHHLSQNSTQLMGVIHPSSLISAQLMC